MAPPEFHLHIGAHEIFPTLLKKASEVLAEASRKNGVRYIGAKEMRSFVNEKSLLEGHLFSPVEYFSISPETRRVVTSGHGLLCPPAKVFTTSGLYNNVGKTPSKIQQKFVGLPVTIFLFIRPQSTYGPVRDFINVGDDSVSWLHVINKIRQAVPHAVIDVWPIEYPNFDSIHIVSNVFGIDLDEDEAFRIEKLSRKERIAAPVTQPSRQERDIDIYLEQLYESDISAIRQLKGVLLSGVPG
ncbi:hypothetical protein [Gymnodinialimonas ceratoperidinii]|uniref:Uncharacterized protein n=1 Tax=Gymnodinialimonas ceratoperidinii TaxID=2856823 RepID=A0A8F6YEE8_9RHOB|nr:hypothetical protein [Gymnodinialimonas ceratoperidinii]QXT41152.1 hypothetical protein KYE46_08075 [Gymnodinialimonas ceratoperidinii]